MVFKKYMERVDLPLIQEEVMKRRIKRPNPFARALASPLHRLRVVKAKKGKGSYKRRPKHSSGRRFFGRKLLKYGCTETPGFQNIPADPYNPMNVRFGS